MNNSLADPFPLVDISYNSFVQSYYSHFSSEIKKLGASKLFVEICSTIKGSLSALKSATGYLERDKYVNKGGQSRYSTLDEGTRALVYQAFDRYQELKAQNYDFDILDMVYVM